jgi:hypothetical protein
MNSSLKGAHNASPRRRWLDDLIEALRRWEEDLRNVFNPRNNRFDPNDPRLVSALLVALGVFLAVAIVLALRAGQS